MTSGITSEKIKEKAIEWMAKFMYYMIFVLCAAATAYAHYAMFRCLRGC